MSTLYWLNSDWKGCYWCSAAWRIAAARLLFSKKSAGHMWRSHRGDPRLTCRIFSKDVSFYVYYKINVSVYSHTANSYLRLLGAFFHFTASCFHFLLRCSARSCHRSQLSPLPDADVLSADLFSCKSSCKIKRVSQSRVLMFFFSFPIDRWTWNMASGGPRRGRAQKRTPAQRAQEPSSWSLPL